MEGTGPTLTKQYCNQTISVTPRVVASDGAGWSDEATFTTNITHIPPVAAAVSGPATVTKDFYSSTCVNVTWTASATGGHPGYTYSWYLGTSTGTTVQRTGSTFTRGLCSNQSVTVKVVDTDGHTATKTFTTSVQSNPAAIVAKITGPATAATNTTTPCANVTWTASASGSGHSGYSYKWYLGTGTTVQGTASTFTKQYCSTTTAATVKLVATASDGHSDDVTFTTQITHTDPPPLTASINGPYEVWASKCPSATWTAYVSGGTPPFSYSWTIGGSTTVQSTGSSLTRSFCTSQYVHVYLTVRDSASTPQTKTATFTTRFAIGLQP